MSAGEKLAKREIAATQHFTEPPPRYSEASLVKRLEELGIGRPSTYASILQVLKDRKYVRLDKRRLYPEDRGRIVVAFLESFFAKYVEYDFTAGLEEQLDLISNNEAAWRDVLRDFWRGFIGAVDEIKDLKISAVIDAARRRHRSAQMSHLRKRPADAQALALRRLYRLLQLSGMPLHPFAIVVSGWRRRYRHQEAWRRPQ
jgi:DNA topoisomerase IA